MNFTEELPAFTKQLNGKGVFLTAGSTPNTMTASWGFSGVMWGKSIIIVPVRTSRFTHDILLGGGCFSVTAPLDNELNKQLAYFGRVSGRDTDKYKESGIVPQKCQNIDTFIIPGNCAHFECKLIYKNEIIKERLDSATIDKCYKDNSFHTMFYGEIVNSYNTF